jgi:hypothetical protein
MAKIKNAKGGQPELWSNPVIFMILQPCEAGKRAKADVTFWLSLSSLIKYSSTRRKDYG